MSVITTKSSVISILKTKNRPSLNHVRFKLPSNVRNILLETKKSGLSKDYEELVVTIRDSEISDADLLKLLEEAKNCISLLDYDLRLFVQAIVILGWTHRSQDVVKMYQEFLVNLVSAHPQHSKVVVEQLVKLFLESDDAEWTEGVVSETEELKFSNNHTIIRAIVRTLPLTQDILLASVKHYFPYYKMSSVKQQAYLHNTLKIIEYLPNARREILTIVFERLLNLDVNCPREDITTADEMVQFEYCAAVEALDYGMLALFQLVDRICRPGEDLRMVEAKSLFNDLLEIFEKCLLVTYGSHHVQFIYFYICSFKQTLVQSFLNSLWTKVMNTSIATVVRKTSVAYLSSYLARADYIPNGFIKTYLSEMTNWCHRYIANQDQAPSSAMEMHNHGVFYSVCQAVFYLIAFRHEDLVDSRKKLVFLQSLNLSKMVNCRLNPLRCCSPAVVENFAAVARDSQLVYCYTIMENNDRSFIRAPTIEEFFPFDPYVLKRSSKYIAPIYRSYYAEPELDDIDEGVLDDDLVKKLFDEEDDFIAEHRRSEKSIDLSYSTSPGFKMSI